MTSTVPTLRRAACLLFGVVTANYLGALVFDQLNPSSHYSSWGSATAVVVVGFALATYCFALVGFLIAWRAPRNAIGWLMLAIGAFWGWSGLTDGYVLYGARTHPGALPAVGVVAALSSWVWVPAIGLMGVYLILLFPDGRLPSPRWRPVAWAAGAALVVASAAIMLRPGFIQDAVVPGVVNPLGLPGLQHVLDLVTMVLVVLPVCILASAVSLIVRFRRSQGLERLQLKWLATAGAVVAAIYAVAMVATLATSGASPVPVWATTVQSIALVSFALIPLAIGVAILKHRLYGIDVVINRSVVFGTLATFITAVYVLIVVGLGSLLGRGDRPNLALSVAATAVVAVAFEPVRDRVQRLANRLVYGARATPYEVLADFADRVGGTYDAAQLLPVMARTVGEGVAAERVEIWLAVGRALTREAAWPTEDGVADRTAAGPQDLRGDRVVPVQHQGELLGAITVVKPSGEQLTPAEGRLLDDVASQAGLVLRNVRLIEELRGSRQRLVRTQDAERRRLERNLHDGAQQSLVAVALMIRMVRARLADGTSPVAETLDCAADQLTLAIDELRDLARGIHPAMLTERGFTPAVGALAERSRVPVVIEDGLGGDRPPTDVEGAMYHVVAEALANVVKHARATEVRVRTSRTEDLVTLEVSDDGVGGADPERGSGLRGLADRVAAVDGAFALTERPGGGTLITCTFPVPPPVPTEVTPAPTRTAQPLGAGQ